MAIDLVLAWDFFRVQEFQEENEVASHIYYFITSRIICDVEILYFP